MSLVRIAAWVAKVWRRSCGLKLLIFASLTILANGNIVKSGDKSVAEQIELSGYKQFA